MQSLVIHDMDGRPIREFEPEPPYGCEDEKEEGSLWMQISLLLPPFKRCVCQMSLLQMSNFQNSGVSAKKNKQTAFFCQIQIRNKLRFSFIYPPN